MTEEKKLSPIEARILQAQKEIFQSEPTSDQIAYLPSKLVQLTLPHSDPGNVPSWECKNGDISLFIQPGLDDYGQVIGFPYGTPPRLILFMLTKEVMKTGNSLIEFGDNFAQFIRDVGLDPSNGTGPRSDAARLRNQMERLFECSIRLRSIKDNASTGDRRRLNIPVSVRSRFWWSTKKPDQSVLFGSYVQLGPQFMDMLKERPVPLDIRALSAIKNSSLALDLYAWATFKSNQVTKLGKPIPVSWHQLMEQIGANYSDVRNFARHAKQSFKKIIEVYPKLRLEAIRGGIMVLPESQSSVPKKLILPLL